MLSLFLSLPRSWRRVFLFLQFIRVAPYTQVVCAIVTLSSMILHQQQHCSLWVLGCFRRNPLQSLGFCIYPPGDDVRLHFESLLKILAALSLHTYLHNTFRPDDPSRRPIEFLAYVKQL